MPTGFNFQDTHGNCAHHHGLAGGLRHVFLSPPGTSAVTVGFPLVAVCAAAKPQTPNRPPDLAERMEGDVLALVRRHF